MKDSNVFTRRRCPSCSDIRWHKVILILKPPSSSQAPRSEVSSVIQYPKLNNRLLSPSQGLCERTSGSVIVDHELADLQ